MRFFRRKNKTKLTRLPAGAFALDGDGRLLVSTLPQNFPESCLREIGQRVLTFFRRAQSAHMPVQELNVYYASLKVTARALRGGAIVFLAPQGVNRNSPEDESVLKPESL